MLSDLGQGQWWGFDLKPPRLTIRESASNVAWMVAALPFAGPSSSAHHRFGVDGVKRPGDTWYRTAERICVNVRYNPNVEALAVSGNTCTGIAVWTGGTRSYGRVCGFVFAGAGDRL